MNIKCIREAVRLNRRIYVTFFAWEDAESFEKADGLIWMLLATM